MKSDLLEHKAFEEWTPNKTILDWISSKAGEMRRQGITFFRASHPVNDVKTFYLEGWFFRPKDQGPLPWEPGYEHHDRETRARGGLSGPHNADDEAR